MQTRASIYMDILIQQHRKKQRTEGYEVNLCELVQIWQYERIWRGRVITVQ